jgi:hypothetical protein
MKTLIPNFDIPLWNYKGQIFNLDPTITFKELYGFVYCISNLISNKKYIGKKFFWTIKPYQINKKKKKRKVESDWKTYWGSNEVLHKDVLKTPLKKLTKTFQREILYLCRTKSECSYFENKEIFVRDSLLNEYYFNDWLSAKITRKHLNLLRLHGEYILK